MDHNSTFLSVQDLAVWSKSGKKWVKVVSLGCNIWDFFIIEIHLPPEKWQQVGTTDWIDKEYYDPSSRVKQGHSGQHTEIIRLHKWGRTIFLCWSRTLFFNWYDKRYPVMNTENNCERRKNEEITLGGSCNRFGSDHLLLGPIYLCGFLGFRHTVKSEVFTFLIKQDLFKNHKFTDIKVQPAKRQSWKALKKTSAEVHM